MRFSLFLLPVLNLLFCSPVNAQWDSEVAAAALAAVDAQDSSSGDSDSGDDE